MSLTLMGILGLAMVLTTINEAAAADKPAKVLRHIVMYKFKDDIKPAGVQEVIDAFAGLPQKIEGIVGFEAVRTSVPKASPTASPTSLWYPSATRRRATPTWCIPHIRST